MTPEEILGKFISGRMMIKEARYVDDALNGPIHEPQTVALQRLRIFTHKSCYPFATELIRLHTPLPRK